MDLPIVFSFSDKHLWFSIGSIWFNCILWNMCGRLEYRTQFLSKLFCGYVYIAAYFFAFVITLLGLHRDWRFQVAIESQGEWDVLDNGSALCAGYGAILIGTILVMSSFWKLGITGTFLGDYFGILMDERITGFPFNILEHPMYVGTALNFLGTALIQKSQVGVFLSSMVWVAYRTCAIFEGRFTTMIYSNREVRRKMV